MWFLFIILHLKAFGFFDSLKKVLKSFLKIENFNRRKNYFSVPAGFFKGYTSGEKENFQLIILNLKEYFTSSKALSLFHLSSMYTHTHIYQALWCLFKCIFFFFSISLLFLTFYFQTHIVINMCVRFLLTGDR